MVLEVIYVVRHGVSGHNIVFLHLAPLSVHLQLVILARTSGIINEDAKGGVQ